MFKIITWSLFLVWIGNLVQPAVAHQPSMRHSQIGTLGHDSLLDFHDLGHVITARTEFLGPNPFVYTNKELVVKIMALIDAPQIPDEIVQFHALKVRCKNRSILNEV